MSAPQSTEKVDRVFETLKTTTAAALRIGFQTRAAEMNLAQLVYDMHGDTDV